MGRLAHQINKMTRGLRQRLELAKFVSDETFRAVEQTEAVERVGDRRQVTVLFSDIRGFTAYSETREPEQVVEMLNAYLQVQAEVVIKHGGDIDKFVGDELMARFDNEGQSARAVEAAVEMVEAVHRLNRARGPDADEMAVGVGINTGEVIVGAMGAESRMDYTVIGDAVNLGAKLCSAAGGGQIVVSETTRSACGDLQSIGFEPIEPIRVKGKTQPINVSLAVRTGPKPD
jgi:adenylate cyclase